jgi:hypothetical protein
MRNDMYKVIVERARRVKGNAVRAARLRSDQEGPMRLGMRAGYGRPQLNENLSPLRRYLCAQVGRPWDRVYGEISKEIDRRNAVQRHIYQHLDDFIAIKVERRADRLVDLRRSRRFWLDGSTIHQELYVDPDSALIRRNKAYQSWRRATAGAHRVAQEETAMRRRILDDCTQLHRLAGGWFLVQIAPLPHKHAAELSTERIAVRREDMNARFDVLLRRSTSLNQKADAAARRELYGSESVYAVSKRQLSRREMKAYVLPLPGG